MKHTLILAVAALIGLSPAAAQPSAGQNGHDAHAAHGAHAAYSSFGKPGSPRKATRTIKVKAFDSMAFDPKSISVKRGETVRFEVTNVGKTKHEFTLGTTEHIVAHEKMMREMPNMVHDDPNSVTLNPGETRTLVWQFPDKPGTVDFACLLPGHYPAGMAGKITVAP